MMQQVNLLVNELRPRRETLSLAQLILLWSAFLGLLLVVSLIQGLDVWRLGREQAQKQAHWQALVEANDTLKNSFDLTPDPLLVTEVETLKQEFLTHSRLVEAVKGYQQFSERGFSGFLEDLATQRVDGVALSRIFLENGGSHIGLSGETEAPVNVPLLLKRLSEGSSFQGHRFDSFHVEEQESGLLRFDISGPARESRR